MLLPAEISPHTVESLYAEHGPARPWTYWLVLAGVIGALASLPLIQVDVSVRAAGLVRSTTGRATDGQVLVVSEAQRLREEQTQYILRAPVDGVLVSFSGWSAGGFVAAGQSLGAISPEDALQVETHVSPRDIGLVRLGQTARLQIDAYPYTQWGTLDGTVTGISGDWVGGAVTGAANANGSSPPGFKVLVRPAAVFLTLPSGVHGELKKGLTLSARFLVARRSVFQLLYADASTWFDPQDNRLTPH